MLPDDVRGRGVVYPTEGKPDGEVRDSPRDISVDGGVRDHCVLDIDSHCDDSMPKNAEGPFPAVVGIAIFAGSAIGAVAPAVVVQYLLKDQHTSQFSLRTLFIFVTLIAALLGIIISLLR